MNLVGPSEMQVLLYLVLYNYKFYVWQIWFPNSTGTTKDEAEETDNFPRPCRQAVLEIWYQISLSHTDYKKKKTKEAVIKWA